MRVYFRPQAEIGLEEIGDYIALDNPERALTFIQEIRQHCERIGDSPMGYVARPDLGDTIRICAHGNYLIIFEPHEDAALILRVLHGGRNPGNSRRLVICGELVAELRGEERDEGLEAGVVGSGWISPGALCTT